MGQGPVRNLLKRQPWTVGLNISTVHVVKELGKEGLSGPIPFDKPRESPMAGWNLITKFPCRGFAGAMRFRETRTKSLRIWKLIAHIDEIAEKEIGLGRGQEKLASSMASWRERRHRLVLDHCVEFAFHHDFTSVISSALQSGQRISTCFSAQPLVRFLKAKQSHIVGSPIHETIKSSMIMSSSSVTSASLPSKSNVLESLLPTRR